MKCISLVMAAALAACTNGQASVDVTSDQELTFPGVPASATALAPSGEVTTNTNLSFDVSDQIKSAGNYGSVSLEIAKNTISGDGLNYIHHIKATVASQDGTKPVQTVADLVVPPGTTQIELTTPAEDAALVLYLVHGKTLINFEVTGELPERPTSLTLALVAHVAVDLEGAIKL